MSNKWSALGGLLVVAGILNACDASGTDVAEEQSGLLTVTSVVRAENGPPQVTVKRVTVAQMEEAKQKRARLITLGTLGVEPSLDSNCSGSSLWVFDAANSQGNLICFNGAGSDDLLDYCDNAIPLDCVSWMYQAASIWAGSSSGHMTQTLCSTTQNFDSWEQANLSCAHGNRYAVQN